MCRGCHDLIHAEPKLTLKRLLDRFCPNTQVGRFRRVKLYLWWAICTRDRDKQIAEFQGIQQKYGTEFHKLVDRAKSLCSFVAPSDGLR